MVAPNPHPNGSYPVVGFVVDEPELAIYHEPALNEILRKAVGRTFRKTGVTSGYDTGRNLGRAAVVALIGYDDDGNVFAFVPQAYIRTPADAYMFEEFEGLDP